MGAKREWTEAEKRAAVEARQHFEQLRRLAQQLYVGKTVRNVYDQSNVRTGVVLGIDETFNWSNPFGSLIIEYGSGAHVGIKWLACDCEIVE